MANCEVVVVGDGLFAVLTAKALHDKGVKCLRVHSSGCGFSENLTGLGVLWSALNDPPTRAAVAHGGELAEYLLQFLAQGLERAQGFLVKNQLLAEKLPSFRVSLSDHESTELREASALFPSLREFKADGSTGSSCWQEPDCVRLEQIWPELREALLEPESARLQGQVVSLSEENSGVELRLADGSTLNAELCVVGAGAASRHFHKRFAEVLVPVVDVVSEYQWGRSELGGDPLGQDPSESFCFRAGHGHVSGFFVGTKEQLRLRITGPRYLLPGAGIGRESSDKELEAAVLARVSGAHRAVMDSVLEHVGHKAAAGFLDSEVWKGRNLVSQSFGQDCLPCDELPLLGEWGAKGRVLGNAGWLGCGHTAAFFASELIVSKILSGKAEGLHPRLSPRRLMTM